MKNIPARRGLVAIAGLIYWFTLSDALQSRTADAPIAKKEPKVTEINGRKLVDDYYWLREKQNPEVAAYLEKENAYADLLGNEAN